MDIARRLLLYVLLLLGVVRMAGYFAFAAMMLGYPLESYFLEAKMVLLAYRVEQGESLYPAWRDYPHVANFFGPVYFVLVGLLGRWTGAGIEGLFPIGRGISFVSGLLTTLVVARTIARRQGWQAGLAGGVLSLGASPMFGFSVMVRPDMMAELFGVVGFLLSASPALGRRYAGVILLVLAILTKQTAGVFLLAAALALAADGERRRALGLLASSLTLLAAVVAINVLVEPNFLSSFLAEGKTPWTFTGWALTLRHIRDRAPDLLLIPLLGLAIGLGDRDRPYATRAVVLTMVLLVSSLVLSGKMGAERNYYLSLRVAEAFAVGTLWSSARLPLSRARSATLAAMTASAAVALWPGAGLALAQALHAHELNGPIGRRAFAAYSSLIALARNPKVHLLTDSGLLELHQGLRAAYGDPWLFHHLAESGRLRPERMTKLIDDQYYDFIITTSDLNDPKYRSYEFGLPMVLVERARSRYVPIGKVEALFVYRRRGTSPNLPPARDPPVAPPPGSKPGSRSAGS